ncbi:hypothetical protein LshimejAT787_0410140 [Lyophyllum shimeji]|uniref:Uncharacterized protein n=1 Tax=Lyophyllum shimeji TaxID=47721 RepID=A0A9P3PL73_LYOSH|nr:hypothetical protein LshimejAT787_0410140 [Lyophyllum shimeji]
MSSSRLPASLTSLYRLCLRASSASVLHHRVASANLRRLLRSTFDAAADVTRQLEKSPSNTDDQAQSKAWLDTFERRMDNTLSLLYTSSQSRGLPHKLTRNLSFLVLGEHQRLIKRHPQKAWDPQIHPASPPKQPDPRKEEKKKRLEDFVNNAWAPLSQEEAKIQVIILDWLFLALRICPAGAHLVAKNSAILLVPASSGASRDPVSSLCDSAQPKVISKRYRFHHWMLGSRTPVRDFCAKAVS